MNLTQIKQDIQTNHISPVYILTGDEVGVMDIYINQIAKVKKGELIRFDNFKQIFDHLKVPSMIGGSGVYYCRDDAEIINNEKIWNLLDNTKWLKKDTIILVFTSIDKRKAFYKRFKAQICEFEPLSDEILIKYIRKQINLSEMNCKRLIEACEHSYSRIMLEIDKIKAYKDSVKEDNKEFQPDICMWYDTYDGIVERFMQDGTIYQPAQDSIFLWSDAVMYRQRQKAFELTEECFKSGEAVLTMLTVLYMNVKQVLQLQSCTSKDISKSTGLTGWQIQCAKKFVNNYLIEELINAMHLIREAEVGIKTGKIEEKAVIPYILVNML